MIKDLLISFRENFKEKTKNPFLGTYLLVWLFRNWELVYTIFNFDRGTKLQDKTSYIQTYYSKHNFLENLFTNIYWAFGVLIITYLLLNLSRVIVNISEKRIAPWVYKITDSKSIVLKSVFESIREERDELQIRLDKERESKSKLENRIKTLEEEIITAATARFEPSLIDKEQATDSSVEKVDTKINFLYEKLKQRNLLKDFVAITVIINKGDTISNDNNPKDYFIELGLIKFEKNSSYTTSKYYKLTEEGQKVLELIRFKE